MTNEKDTMELDDDNVVVVFKGEDGEELYFVEEEVFTVEGNTYAILASVNAGEDSKEEHSHGCGCGHHHKHKHEGCEHFHEHHAEYADDAEEGEAIIAKIIEGEDGELEYVEPSDEEFEIALAAYESLIEGEE